MCEQTVAAVRRNKICLERSSSIFPLRQNVWRHRSSSLQSSKHSWRHFFVSDVSYVQLKSGHQVRWPPPPTPFYDREQKINDESGTHYCFTSEQEHNQMFHICSCLLDISMTMCRLCINAAQLTAWGGGQRPQKWPSWPVPDVPACCRNKRRSRAFYTSHPMSFLSYREEMLSPTNPPRIPSQDTNDLTLLFVDITAKMFSFINFYLLLFVTKGFQTHWSGLTKRSQDKSEGSDIIHLRWLTSFFHTK